MYFIMNYLQVTIILLLLIMIIMIMIIYNFLNDCPFDYTAFAVGGKVRIP